MTLVSLLNKQGLEKYQTIIEILILPGFLTDANQFHHSHQDVGRDEASHELVLHNVYFGFQNLPYPN